MMTCHQARRRRLASRASATVRPSTALHCDVTASLAARHVSSSSYIAVAHCRPFHSHIGNGFLLAELAELIV